MAPDDALQGELVTALDLDGPHARRARDDYYARDLDGPGYPPVIDVEPEPAEVEHAEARAADADDDAAREEADDADGDPGPDSAGDEEPAAQPRRRKVDDGRDPLRAALLEANGARRVRYGRLPASLRARGVTAGVFVYGTSTVVVLR